MIDQELLDEERQQQFDARLWRRILKHARPYRLHLFALAASGLVLASIDVLLPRVTGLIMDEAITNGAGSALTELCRRYFALVVTMALLIWFFIVTAGRAATGLAYGMRRAAFAGLQELSFSFYDRRSVGWLMARLTSDCERVSSIIPWFLLDLVWGTTLITGTSVMMLRLNRELGLLVILVLPPMAVVSLVFQRKLLRSQRAVRKTNSQLTASFNEAIMGVRTTKTLVREKENLGEFQVQSSSMYRHSMRNALQAAVYLPAVITIGSIGIGLALWKGGVQIGGGMSLGTLVTFMQYAGFFYVPIQELAERFTQLQAAQASTERLQGLLDTEPEIKDAPEIVEAIRWRELVGCDDGLAIDGYEDRIESIEFDDVSFAYKEGVPVLADFNLKVQVGETIALVGATGSGKTTIVGLLSRFYEPTSGSIQINGVDYRRRSLQWLQSKLGIVLQSPHLFSGTVRENIRYGRLDASDEEVAEAARIVNADAFITSLDDGYDTDVGEGGNRLSTGQKQLVSLARAVLSEPEIFIMDEATSSVDTETERLIQDAIDVVLKGRISFIIAHRLSTVRSADRILVIDQGKLVEQGSHEELIRKKGRYYQLYTSQFTRERQERVLQQAAQTAV